MEKYFTKEYLIKLIITLSIVIIPIFLLEKCETNKLLSTATYNVFKNSLISIFTGVGASYMFLRIYLFNKKPKILISEHICKMNLLGKMNYVFKFVNNSDVELYDVRIEAKILTPFNDVSGKNLRGEEINFVDNNIYFLPCKTAKDDFNLHSIRIRTLDDLETRWKECDGSSYVRLTIIAKHSLSGFNKVFVKDFLHPDTITQKKFQKGDDLSVK